MWIFSGGPMVKGCMVVMIWLVVIVTVLNWIVDLIIWLKS